jgi:hypothetical protein
MQIATLRALAQSEPGLAQVLSSRSCYHPELGPDKRHSYSRCGYKVSAISAVAA